MRISDWSSDVCSSDLMEHFLAVDKNSPTQASASMLEKESSEGISVLHKFAPMYENIQYVDFDTKSCEILNIAVRLLDCQLVNDRKSVVYGKSVSVRVYLGGRSIIKKKNKTKKR